MLSELAIDDAKGFAALVKIAKDANDGKIAKKVEAPKAEAKKETVKKEAPAKKEEAKKDYSKMTLAELKEVAKNQDVKGYSTMKKAELLAAIK